MNGSLARLGMAKDAFGGLSAKYGAGTDLYLDSLGVNGAEGNTRASAAFTPSLSYDFNLDQNVDAINRRRAAGGMLASGNADRDAQIYGAGLASNEVKGWQDRLAGLISPEVAAVTGAAGADTNAANIINSGGVARAGVETGRGAMLADLASRYGGSMAGLDTGEATQKVGLATNLAQPYASTYKNEADAEMAGSGNIWNMGLNLAKLGLGGLGGMGGGNLGNVGGGVLGNFKAGY